MSTLENTTDLLRILGDHSRVRLLQLLAHEELTVTELTEITHLGQSRVSTHLGKLRDAGLVHDRRAGASAYYRLNADDMPTEARALWDVICQSRADPILEEDQQRLSTLIRARGGSWADTVAGQMERYYSPGRTWEAAARGLLGLAKLGDVLDVASGDGALAELVARSAESVTCLDLSPRVMLAAKRRLQHLRNVRFQVGDLHALPYDKQSFDHVLFMNTLSYAQDPKQAVVEAARVLRNDGTLAASVLNAHRHHALAKTYGHCEFGFKPTQLKDLFSACGFDVTFCDVTSREKRPPHFEVVTLYARRQPRRSK